MFVWKDLLGFEFTRRSLLTLAFLAVIPNFFGWLVINVPWGAGKFHAFQLLIFIAAGLFGPLGGAFAGAFGAVGTAVALNNPYVIVGNIVLGGLTGYLYLSRKWSLALSVLAAYAVQIPWLYYTDVYLVRMPASVVNGMLIALLISNVVMALIASAILPALERYYHASASGV